MKKITASVLLLILVFAPLSATGQKEAVSSTQPTKRFAFVSPIIGHPYWVTVAEGVADASKELGVSTRESGPIGEINIDTQIRDIETAIASKVDGILTMALNPEAFTPVINRAIEAGIPVVLIDTDAPNSIRSAYAGTSNFDAGYSAGKALAEKTQGNAYIGIITGAIDADNLNLRIDGFRKAIAEYPGMKIIDVQDSNSNMLIQTEKAQSMLQAFPQLNAFFGTDATSAIAAAKIVQEKGLAGKVAIVGFDDLAETLDYIRSGVIHATAVQRNYRMGYLGVELLVRLANGEKLESDIVDTGVTMVTKANVETY